MKTPDFQRLGRAGVIGLGLMLFNLSFYLGSVAPDQESLADLERQRAALLERSPQAISGAADESRPASALAPSPSLTQVPELLRSVYSLATQRGLVIDRASYALSEKEGPLRIEINLPMHTSYLVLRSFLSDLGGLKPSPAIDELTMKRRQASDSLIEATLRLSWQLAPGP